MRLAARVADEIKAAVRSHPELEVIGDSLFNVAFRSDELDIFHVNDALSARNWRLNGLQHPAGVHFSVRVNLFLARSAAGREGSTVSKTK